MTSPRRLRRRSPAPATPLDDDDLLSEILLRLPPQPSSLPRASLVCKRWRRLVSDPAFSRRFRARHRRNPPLLGFFNKDDLLSFQPTLDPPNRVPRGRFSFHFDDGHLFEPLGCRHGLVLIFQASRNQVLVWDPVTGDRHGLAVPPGLAKNFSSCGAVRRAAGDVHFQVVLVSYGEEHTRAVACVYSSETGVWGNLISTPLPSNDVVGYRTAISTGMPAVLLGDSLYWSLVPSSAGIIEFDLDRQSLAVIPVPPVDVFALCNSYSTVMRAEGGGIGFLSFSGFSAQLWKRKTDSDGVASWVLGRTIELDKILPVNSGSLSMIAFAEENNVAFLWTVVGLFMVQLESLQFKKLFKTKKKSYHPFESVYAADVHDSKIKRAKSVVMKRVLDGNKGQYLKLFDYQVEILRSNPGNTVAIFLDPDMQKSSWARWLFPQGRHYW